MRAWLACLAFLAAAFGSASGILIAQRSESRANEADPNRHLLQFVAEAIDNDGRLNPIAWSMADPIFRTAANDKLVREGDNPDLAEVLKGSDKLKAEWVLVVTVFKKDEEIYGRAKLLHKGQQVWSDPEAENGERLITVRSNAKVDLSNTLRAAASTWTQLMFAGPLKSLGPQPKISTPPIEPGVSQKMPDPPAPPVKVDNKELLAQVMKLLASGKPAEAIATLRDAVDAEPLDAERRKALANTLATSGYNESAAGEARRAAELFPDQADLRTQAARFWMAAGNIEEANTDLNEAVARNPESVETRMLLGEVALSKLQVDAAIAHFDFVLSKAQIADAYFKRSLAKAMNDDPEGCRKDLDEATKLGLGKDALEVRTQYAAAIRVSQAALSEMAVAMRTLFQRARAKFGDKDVREDQKTLVKRTQALIALSGALATPPAHKNSQGRRVLALKLLDQSLSELGTYLDSGSDDAIGDATITLGEALKALTAADDAYKAELSKG